MKKLVNINYEKGKESILISILILKIGGSLLVLPITTLLEVLDSEKPIFALRSICWNIYYIP